jgi:hypothetical protein
MNDGLVLGREQIPDLKLKALKGDGEAARKLFLDPSVGDKERVYWLTISAEDDDPAGMYTLVGVLNADDSDPHNKIRARYWLERAEKRGDTHAHFELEEMRKNGH